MSDEGEEQARANRARIISPAIAQILRCIASDDWTTADAVWYTMWHDIGEKPPVGPPSSRRLRTPTVPWHYRLMVDLAVGLNDAKASLRDAVDIYASGIRWVVEVARLIARARSRGRKQ